MDRNIGRILDYLDKTGLAKNTIVIYTSDQGFYMGEHGWFDKRFMYEESLRTPFVMRYPGKLAPGKVVNNMLVNIDFAPTLIDLAGIKVPADMHGKSFATLLSGSPVKDWRKAMYYHYYEYPQPHHVAPHFGIRTERYKLIRFYGPHDAWELFDLQNDRLEVKNLIDDPSKKALIADLKRQLKSLVLEFKDEDALQVLGNLAKFE
jgi:arylsulfatase A-like enzyme